MDETSEQALQLKALAMRVAALEDSVAFLEQWCEEQQDVLDRTAGPMTYDYEGEAERLPPPVVLRVVDLRDVETEPDAVGQLQLRLNRLRARLASSLAPPDDQQVSAKPAGRTAP